MNRVVGPALVAAILGVAGSIASAANAMPTGSSIADVGMVNHGTPPCASCHGFQGQGVKSQNGPRLAGLNADYLVRQLQAFKTGAKAGRDSQRMSAVARTLTDDQMQMVADYYASLPPIGAPSVDVQGDVALGGRIATQGKWSQKIPPCASCHGADGLGVNDLSPPLAGQRADYLVRELNRFRSNERRDDPLGLMRGISAKLTVQEIRSVAAYYATLSLTPATHPANPPVQQAAKKAPRR